MGETANYKLYVTDDATERFQDWRRKLSAPTDQNMTKIDTALSEKADKSKALEVIVQASKWTGAMYQIDMPGTIKATHNGFVSLSDNMTDEQLAAAMDAGLIVASQGDGFIMLLAKRTIPTIDIKVVITLIN